MHLSIYTIKILIYLSCIYFSITVVMKEFNTVYTFLTHSWISDIVLIDYLHSSQLMHIAQVFRLVCIACKHFIESVNHHLVVWNGNLDFWTHLRHFTNKQLVLYWTYKENLSQLTPTMTVSVPWNLGMNLSPRRFSDWFKGRKRHNTLMLHSELTSAILQNWSFTPQCGLCLF